MPKKAKVTQKEMLNAMCDIIQPSLKMKINRNYLKQIIKVVLNAYIDVVVAECDNNREVFLMDFGRFSPKIKKGRRGFSHLGGGSIPWETQDTKTIVFKLSNLAKEVIAEEKGEEDET